MIILYKNNKVVEIDPQEYNNVIDNLYYLYARLPTEKELKKFNQKIFLKDIKDAISNLEFKIPLFDPFSHNMYIIDKRNVYNRVMNDHYRFPTIKLIDNLKEERDELRKNVDPNNLILEINTLEDTNGDIDIDKYHKKHQQIFRNRKYHKLSLMLLFMDSFNMEILEKTYVKIFYYYSNKVGKNITLCKRPSFVPHFKHISPYYTRSELINMGLNMKIIKSSDEYYDQESIDELCEKTRTNDISSKVILEHQNHVIDQNKIGVIQYYSLMGAYFINRYLRNQYKYQNELIDEASKELFDLVRSAPAFNKDYVLYRFIQDDDYLYGLKQGDIHTENSFISTTRDPFYTVQQFKFGYILIKINLPKNMKGVGLCMESYSNFPMEEEIILPPGTKLRLDSTDLDTIYFHPDPQFSNKVKKRYEFTIIGNNNLILNKKQSPSLPQSINFLDFRGHSSISMIERIKKFIQDHLNENFQFKTKINNKEEIFNCEWYNSTTVYKKFYYSENKNGFCIYLLNKGNIRLLIEIGENEKGYFMAVNYYSRYSNINDDVGLVKDNKMLILVAQMAYFFKINKVIIFANYKSTDIIRNKKIELYGGRYCEDFYLYIKDGTKRFSNTNIKRHELKPGFDYFLLDNLTKVEPTEILKKTDKDDLYQIYKKTFIHAGENNLRTFYLWIIDHHSYLINALEDKMIRYFGKENPFTKDYYIFNASSYLYNRDKIKQVPSEIHQDNISDTTITMPKNTYRIFSDDRGDRRYSR